MNAILWHAVNSLGWIWWFPPCVLAAINLGLLSRLNAPVTRLGRVARVFAWVAHVPMLFVGLSVIGYWWIGTTPLNSLGLIALPLMIVGNTLFYTQLFLACRVVNKQATPNHRHWAQKVLGVASQ